MRRHSTTQRLPREHFEAVEAARLLPGPTTVYDVPTWCDPKVGGRRGGKDKEFLRAS
jgi:hypothetical protein